MSEPDKPLTEAEKQIRRLESLRHQREDASRASTEKAFSGPKTAAEKTADRLMAMRDRAHRAEGGKKPRLKIEGKQKSSKLTFTHIRALEQIFAADKRLRGSVVTRIALNRVLGIDNTELETELEAKLHEILRQIKNRA